MIRIKDLKCGLIILFIVTAAPLHSQPDLYGPPDFALNPKKLNRKVDNWVKGKVTFKDGKTIRCIFSYNPLVPEGLLKIKYDDRLITATVFDVESFTYYNEDTSTEHRYFSLPFHDDRPAFVELLYEGAFYALLGRKTLLIKKHYYSHYDFPAYVKSSSTTVKTRYQWFLVNMKTREINKLSRKGLVHLFKDRKKDIKKFIKANKLKFRNTKDYIMVVQQYEKLIDPKKPLSQNSEVK